MESIKIRLKEALELIEDLEENGKKICENSKTAQLKRTFLDIRKMSVKIVEENTCRWEKIHREKRKNQITIK